MYKSYICKSYMSNEWTPEVITKTEGAFMEY